MNLLDMYLGIVLLYGRTTGHEGKACSDAEYCGWGAGTKPYVPKGPTPECSEGPGNG